MPSEYSEHNRIPMQHLVISAAQDPTYDHKEQFGGAQIACWIKDQTHRNAAYIARGWIEDNGWVVLAVEEQSPVTDETYAADSEHRPYYEQALTDSEVFVFYTFPQDATE